jgi:hypothetical protein
MSKIKIAQSFWMWFLCHEKVYLHLGDINEKEQDEWLDELLNQLRKYNRDLGYVLNLEHGIHAELIITAEGNFRLFQDIIFLTDMAPVMEDWAFINFMYPTDVTGAFIYEDIILYPDDIYFTARKNNKRLGLLDLQLYMDVSQATRQSANFTEAINILLLNLLGEIDFATTIGRCSVNEMPAIPGKKALHELCELPEFVSRNSLIKSLIPAIMRQGFIF